MSDTIDERVVEMRFNNKQFEKNAEESIKTLNKLNESLDLKGSSEGFEMLNKSIKAIDLSNIEKSTDSIAKRFDILNVAAQQVVRNLTDKLVNFGLQWTKSLSIGQISAGFDKYARKTESVQTIMNATGKSIEEVSKVLAKLNTYTDETSYSYTEMASSIGKFTSAGVDLEVAETAMEGIANWAAKAGVGTDRASSAFYNISQAIGSGALKLQDWKSIENLNMATKDVKEQFIEAGLAAGTLIKQGSKIVTKLGRSEVTVNAFNNSLQKGWITKDVILATMQKYADTTQEFGLNAYHAAQEAKTFKDAIDAVKDAVSTGWMNVFELIFGNYEEAKTVWTSVANELIEVFSMPTESLSKILKYWHKNGGYEAFIESVANAWTGLKSVISEVGQVFESIFPSLSPKSLVAFTEKVRDLTASFKDLVTKKEIPGTLKMLGRSMEDTMTLYDKGYYQEVTKHNEEVDETLRPILDIVRGLLSLLDGVKTVIKAIFTIASPLLKLIGPFARLFGVIASSIGNFITNTVNATVKSEKFAEIVAKVEQFVSRLSDIIGNVTDNFADFLEELLNLPAVNTLGKILSDTWNSIKEFASPYLSKATAKLNEFIDASNVTDRPKILSFINGLIQWFIDFGATAVRIGKKIYSFLSPLFKTIGWAAQFAFSKIGSAIKFVHAKLKEFVNSAAFQSVKNKALTVLRKISDKIIEIGSGAKKAFSAAGITGLLGYLLQTLREFWNGLKEFDFKNVFNDLSIGIEAFAAVVAARNLKKLTSAISGALAKIGGFPAALKSMATTFAKGLYIKRIAESILMLSGAIYILSQVPVEKVFTYIAALSLLGGVLAGLSVGYNAAIGALTKIGFINTRSMRSASFTILAFSSALFILAKAMVAINEIPTDNLFNVFVVLSGIMTVLAGTGLLLGLAGNGIKNLGIGLIGVAASVILLILAFGKINDYLQKLEKNVDLFNKGLATVLIISGVVVVLTAVSFAMQRIIKSSWQTAAVIAALGAAIFLVSLAIEHLQKTGIAELFTLVMVLGILLGAMAGIAGVSRLMKAEAKQMLSIGAALAGLGIGVLLLVGALKLLTRFDRAELQKALADLGIILFEVSVALLAASRVKANGNAFTGIAAMVIAIVGVLWILTKFDYGEIFIAASLLGGILLALGTSLAIGQKALSGVKSATFFGLAFLVGVIGTVLILMSHLDKDFAGMLVAATSLGSVFVALAGSLRLAGKSLADVKIMPLLGISLIIAAIGTSLIWLSYLPMEQVLASSIALSGTLMTLSVAFKILSKMASSFYIGQVMQTLFMFVTMLAPVVAALTYLGKAGVSGKAMLANALSIVMVVSALSGAVALLSVIPNVTPMQWAGLGVSMAAMATMLGSVGLALVLMSKNIKDPSSLMSIAKSVSALIAALTFATASLSLIGMVSNPVAALSGIGGMLVVIAGLSAIIAGIYVLNDWLSGKGIDVLSVIDTVSGILGALGNALGSFVGGFAAGVTSALPKIADNINDFVTRLSPAIEKFNEFKIVPGNAKGLEALGKAILAFTAADFLEGVQRFFSFGKDKGIDFESFADGIGKLGPGLKTFAESTKGIDSSAVSESAGAIESLASVAKTLSRSGGILQKVIGEPRKLGEFAEDLVKAITDENGNSGGIIKYAEQAHLIANKRTAIENSAKAIQALVDVANAIDPTNTVIGGKSGGWAIYQTYAQDLGTFASSLPSVGENIAGFYEKIKGMPETSSGTISDFAGALSALAEVANLLDPEKEGSISFLGFKSEFSSSGAGDLGTFIKSLSSIGPDLTTFMGVFTPSVVSRLSFVGSTFEQFIRVSNELQTAVGTGSGIFSFVSSLSDTATALNTANSYWGNVDLDMIESRLGWIQRIAEQFFGAIDMPDIGEGAISGIVSAMKSSAANEITPAATEIAAGIASAIGDHSDEILSVGSNFGAGLIEGLRGTKEELSAAAGELAAVAISKLEALLEINSPSKVTRRIGNYTGEGLVLGINGWADKAEASGANLADSTLSGMTSALEYINTLLLEGFDTDYTIRPVLDLTNVENGASEIDNLFSHRQAVMASIEADAATDQANLDQLVEVGWKILKEIQNGSDLYFDDGAFAGRINRKLGAI